jgi:Flp pilus assembly protein TadD
VSAAGTDVFRIFVVGLPVTARRYVRALEFRAGSSGIVHHANIRIDHTPTSRAFDDADPAPGYDGLIARTAGYPDGHFLAWTPGQVAPLLPKGLAWTLEPGTDLVVELHLQPAGRTEVIQPTIGLFFGSDPPERTPVIVRLGRQQIDIAPGQKDYVVTDSFVMPVDTEVLALQPHAHFRARHVRATARLPEGREIPLISISDWDVRWQQVYRLRTPVPLPRGTRLSMEYRYDNSSENPRNIAQPPARVTWGQRAGDEMADCWIQVATRNDADRDALSRAFRPKQLADDIVGYEARLRAEPSSVELHDDVAVLYMEAGRLDGAVDHFRRSVQLRPGAAATHFNLATALAMAGGRGNEAEQEYRRALEIRPDYALAHNNLGGLFLQQGRLDEAAAQFQEAARLDAGYAEALDNLGRVELQRGDRAAALNAFERAAGAKTNWPTALGDLAWVLATGPDRRARAERAIGLAESAVRLTGRRDAWTLNVLAAAYAAAGDVARAVRAADEALTLAPDAALSAEIRARRAEYLK